MCMHLHLCAHECDILSYVPEILLYSTNIDISFHFYIPVPLSVTIPIALSGRMVNENMMDKWIIFILHRKLWDFFLTIFRITHKSRLMNYVLERWEIWRRSKVGFCVLINFLKHIFLWGTLRGWGMDMEVLGKKRDWDAWYKILK